MRLRMRNTTNVYGEDKLSIQRPPTRLQGSRLQRPSRIFRYKDEGWSERPSRLPGGNDCERLPPHRRLRLFHEGQGSRFNHLPQHRALPESEGQRQMETLNNRDRQFHRSLGGKRKWKLHNDTSAEGHSEPLQTLFFLRFTKKPIT